MEYPLSPPHHHHQIPSPYFLKKNVSTQITITTTRPPIPHFLDSYILHPLSLYPIMNS